MLSKNNFKRVKQLLMVAFYEKTAAFITYQAGECPKFPFRGVIFRKHC